MDEEHFRLDKLLNRAEQDQREIEMKEKELNKLLRENERLKKEMEQLLDKEKHSQQIELLRHQNKMTEEKIAYLKDMERKLKQIAIDWKKTEDKENKKELMRQLRVLLFPPKKEQGGEKAKKKINSKYQEVGGDIRIGNKVLMKKNHQVGEVKEIRGKKAVVQLGMVPITVEIGDLVVVAERG